MDIGVRVQTLRRAAEIVGGLAQLLLYLNVSALCLAAWMTGVDNMPTQVFLKAVDLVMEEGAKKPLYLFARGTALARSVEIPFGACYARHPDETSKGVRG